ncbi:uncharacterized protein LOC132314781 [Cornus florida]|uniref:uncharacterized protein LOC132314781 n=1 Tax=Cornus florida TaxID=4283 RepID=UPI00289AACAE|nr:uncharacterized protein LOC132314781 [Cornus florida]
MDYSLNKVTPNPLLRRRNSIATTKLSLPSKLLQAVAITTSSTPSFPTVDLELIKPPLSYTSLKDILPSTASVLSPTSNAVPVSASCEISIRNRLVKQAAWSYLQPLSTSPDSVGPHFLRRLWVRFSCDYVKNPFTAFLRFFDRRILQAITRVFDRLIRLVRVRSHCL